MPNVPIITDERYKELLAECVECRTNGHMMIPVSINELFNLLTERHLSRTALKEISYACQMAVAELQEDIKKEKLVIATVAQVLGCDTPVDLLDSGQQRCFTCVEAPICTDTEHRTVEEQALCDGWKSK